MHQRTWLSLLTLPLVGALSYPVFFEAPLARTSPSRTSPAKAQDPLAEMADIQDVLALVRDNYVDPPDLEKVVMGGVQAALERAHPMNAYISPEELRLPDPGPATCGVRVVKRGLYAHVVAVAADSPAERAGIRPGDVIRKIDGQGLGTLSAWALERRLRGAEGSKVTLLRYASGSAELKSLELVREKPKSVPLEVHRDPKVTVVVLQDLEPGRANELRALFAGLDPKLPLVLDLRRCGSGDLEEAARVAGLFAGEGTLATVQEAGKADRVVPIAVQPQRCPAARVAVLQGIGTAGPSEALVSALRKQGLPTFGERSAALGVERSRFNLRQGGAVEMVNRRYLGAGGERLGFSGDRTERALGINPQHVMRPLRPEEDLVPRILEILESRPAKEPAKGPDTAAFRKAPRGGHLAAVRDADIA